MCVCVCVRARAHPCSYNRPSRRIRRPAPAPSGPPAEQRQASPVPCYHRGRAPQPGSGPGPGPTFPRRRPGSTRMDSDRLDSDSAAPVARRRGGGEGTPGGGADGAVRSARPFSIAWRVRVLLSVPGARASGACRWARASSNSRVRDLQHGTSRRNTNANNTNASISVASRVPYPPARQGLVGRCAPTLLIGGVDVAPLSLICPGRARAGHADGPVGP